MPNINLYQNNEVEEKISQERMVDIGMISAVVIFVLALLGYGGVFLYQDSLKNKTEATKAEIMEAKKGLDAEKVNLVASVQQRLDMISSKKESFAKDNPEDIFIQLQKVMVKGAVVSNVVYSNKVVSVKIIADDMDAAARQVASFKKSSFFSGAGMKNISVGENRDVELEVEAVIQN